MTRRYVLLLVSSALVAGMVVSPAGTLPDAYERAAFAASIDG